MSEGDPAITGTIHDKVPCVGGQPLVIVSSSEDSMVTANSDATVSPPKQVNSVLSSSQLENSSSSPGQLAALDADTNEATETKELNLPEGASNSNSTDARGDNSRPTARSGSTLRSSSAETKRTESANGGKAAATRSDSLSRKEREEKVRETREKMEKDKERKLQELLDVQKTAEELRLKQQEIRKKRLEDLKTKDGERQRAAEERRKRREQEEEERKRNFLKKRLERANRADSDTRLKKGKHESYGFGSSAPRFEDIILTSSPGTRSMSQLNLSTIRKSANSGDEADHDSPRPGSATPGEVSSPQTNQDGTTMYMARPLSKSSTNITTATGSKRLLQDPTRQRRISAGASLAQSDVEHTLQQRGQRRKPRISFSPVTLISTPSGGGPAARSRAVSNERTANLSASSSDRLSRSSLRQHAVVASNKSGAMGNGGAPATRAKSTELPDNLKKSVARLSAVKTPSTDPVERSKLKPNTSVSHTNLSAVSKSRVSHSPIELIKTKPPAAKLPKRSSSARMGSRSMTTGDMNKVGLSRTVKISLDGNASSSSTTRKPLTSNIADRKLKQPAQAASGTDSEGSSQTKTSLKSRSSSATRGAKPGEESPSSYESRSKTLERPSKAQKAAKAEAMSKSLYAPSSLSPASSGSNVASSMKKARSVGNISKAHIPAKKDGDVPKTPTRSALAKSNSADPVKSAKKSSTPSKTAGTSSKPSTPVTHKPATPSSKPATPAGKTATPTGKPATPASSKPASKTSAPGAGSSRRSSKDSNSTQSPKTTTPTAEVEGKLTDTDSEVKAASDSTDAKSPASPVSDQPPSKSPPTVPSTAQSVAAKDEPKKSAKAAEMDEYKAKLAEKRREAREKAERDAEEERKRQEEARLAEEQRLKEEEEKERLFEIEQNRLAAEARKLEQERLEKAIEDEEKRRKEEAERLEAERIAKEQANERAKVEAEAKEKERLERIAKEEQEKLERKKKLEMIMKRVKTSSPTPDRSAQPPSSEPPSMSSSMSGSLSGSIAPPASAASAMTSSFKSPLLQGLMNNKNADPSQTTPEKKFTSSLLNNLMAKVSADRSEDNSSGSSSNSNANSQQNSSQTSPEHKSLPLINTQEMGEDNSQLSVEVAADNSSVSIEQRDSNSKPLVGGAIESSNGIEGPAENGADGGYLASSESDSNINTNNVDSGSHSQKALLENGASNTQNGGTHTHYQNGDKSAGIPEEKQGTFEEVIKLSNEQREISLANPAPIVAFDESTAAHTEGGDALHTAYASPVPHITTLHDQRSTSGVAQIKTKDLNTLTTFEEKSWKNIDRLMLTRREETIDKLHQMNIGEGDPDDESDEGQIWQMVEGRSPYTLDMV